MLSLASDPLRVCAWALDGLALAIEDERREVAGLEVWRLLSLRETLLRLLLCRKGILKDGLRAMVKVTE
jgi:hypothetical protein